LVLLVLLRLAEDVAVFQSVDAVRRRDLQQGLTANMSDMFEFLSRLLRAQVTAYHDFKLSGAPAAQFHCRLALSVIAVYQAHVEWVSINHIMAHDGQLLVLLCTLLSEEKFRLSAAECLLQVKKNETFLWLDLIDLSLFSLNRSSVEKVLLKRELLY
jgi:exportin-5